MLRSHGPAVLQPHDSHCSDCCCLWRHHEVIVPQPPPSPTRAWAPPPPTEAQAPVVAGHKRHVVSEYRLLGWAGVEQKTALEKLTPDVDRAHVQYLALICVQSRDNPQLCMSPTDGASGKGLPAKCGGTYPHFST